MTEEQNTTTDETQDVNGIGEIQDVNAATQAQAIGRTRRTVKASDVTAKVEEELLRGASFDNSHGITRENLRRFLIPSYLPA